MASEKCSLSRNEGGLGRGLNVITASIPNLNQTNLPMKTILIPILGAALLAAAPLSSCAAPAAKTALAPMPKTGTVTLRGYGQVAATFAPNRAEFVCENADKADLLMGKLLADEFWDAGDAHTQKTVKQGNVNLIVHQQDGAGALIAARAGNRVIVLSAPDVAALLQSASKEPLLKNADTKFAPAKAYPIYLDFYDLRAFKFYTGAMDSRLGLDTHWPFIKKFGLGGLTVQGPNTNFNNPAPGVIQWAPYDYEVREASKNGGMIMPSLWLGGEVALWMHNDYPDSMMQPSPTALEGAWGYGVGTTGAHFLSWGLPQKQADATIGQVARQVVDRYKDSSAVGGWHLYAGSPGGEMAYHDRTTSIWDYSVAGQEGFRSWLRDERKMSLAEVGKRWTGDANHFKNWSEVQVPDVRGFYGGLVGGDALRIADGWQWKKADPNQKTQDLPDANATDWIPVAMPPSQEQVYLPWGAAFYRVSFDASAWMQGKTGKKYLTVDTNDISAEGTQVWMNGQLVGQFKPQNQPGPWSFDATEFLKTGVNQLVMRVPSGRNPNADGKLYGPVTLTTDEPKFYPYLGRELNAKWVDVREWQAYGMFHGHVLAAQAARAADANRPIILSATESALGNFNDELATRFGMGLQFTGREAYYFPWATRTGIVAGYYGSGEPSNVVSGEGLDRMIGWSLFDADSNVDMFQGIEQYIEQERESGWFTKHQSLLRLYGKYLPEQPKIVILHSAQTQLLGSHVPEYWDIGRGELANAHYDWGYATEREVRNGQIGGTPILFDSNSEFMDEATLSGIENFVRAGGTFVALQQSGRHSPLEPDTYPISRLTGFKVSKTAPNGIIKFGADLPLFKGWENREFDGREGIALDVAGVAPGANVLAKWSDGSGAFGVRTIGKGRVITLASSFWRDQGNTENEFLDKLFGELGVTRNASSSDAGIWTRKSITKNGLQDWLIAYNTGDARRADVSFRVDDKPAQVWDLLTKTPVDFTYENGLVKVAGVDFANQQTRAFASKRAQGANGLPFWWAEKVKYWQPSEGGAFAPAQTNTRTIPFNQWKFATDADDKMAQETAWMQTGYDDKSWETMQIGPWNLQDEKLKDYRGTGLYRAAFTVPPAWKGRTMTLNFYSYNTPIVYDKGEFFINGQKVTDYSSHGGSQTLNYDVTPLLKEGKNVLSVRAKGGKELSGVAGAIWLEPERAFDQTLDLAGDWQAIGPDYLTRKTVRIPGEPRAKYLEKTVEIPADWAGRETFIHVDVPGNGQWMKSVSINGHPITLNMFAHPFGLRTEINLSPYVRYGAPNTIQIWPWNTMPVKGEQVHQAEDGFNIAKVYLGRTK